MAPPPTITHAEAQQQVSDNYEAFIRMLSELLDAYSDQWAVLRDQEVIGIFPTDIVAYRYAVSEYPDERWSIQHIREQTPIRMGAFSRAPRH